MQVNDGPLNIIHRVICAECGHHFVFLEKEMTPPETKLTCPDCGTVTYYYTGEYDEEAAEKEERTSEETQEMA